MQSKKQFLGDKMNSAETREAASSYCFHRQPYTLLPDRIARPGANKEIKSGKEIKKAREKQGPEANDASLG